MRPLDVFSQWIPTMWPQLVLGLVIMIGLVIVIVNFRHVMEELWRVRWPLLSSCSIILMRRYGVLPPQDDLTVIAYKISLAMLGFVVAHIVRQQAFSYINLGDMLLARDPAAGMCVLAMAILYAAFIVGILTGL